MDGIFFTPAENMNNTTVSSANLPIPRSLICEPVSSVLTAVNTMGKVTACEIAKHITISCAEAIALLLYLERFGLVSQLNGYWMTPEINTESFVSSRDLNRRVIRRRKAK